MASLVILYGKGGLSDVGRHAVQAALERGRDEIASIKVLTKLPELLEEPNWNCGCPEPHKFSDEERKRFELCPVESWDDHDAIASHFEGATAVVSCVGNRQPFIGGWDAHAGTKSVIKAMQQHGVSRLVSMNSVGIEEDWPPLEKVWYAKAILGLLFILPGFARRAAQDLTQADRAVRQSDLDYLLIRPVGLGEEVVPVGTWQLQKKKYTDAFTDREMNMAKLDCARYMIEEALKPTKHKEAVVVGNLPIEEESS